MKTTWVKLGLPEVQKPGAEIGLNKNYSQLTDGKLLSFIKEMEEDWGGEEKVKDDEGRGKRKRDEDEDEEEARNQHKCSKTAPQKQEKSSLEHVGEQTKIGVGHFPKSDPSCGLIVKNSPIQVAIRSNHSTEQNGKGSEKQ